MHISLFQFAEIRAVSHNGQGGLLFQIVISHKRRQQHVEILLSRDSSRVKENHPVSNSPRLIESFIPVFRIENLQIRASRKEEQPLGVKTVSNELIPVKYGRRIHGIRLA